MKASLTSDLFGFEPPAPGLLRCSACHEEKAPDEFTPRRDDQSRRGRNSRCRDCNRRAEQARGPRKRRRIVDPRIKRPGLLKDAQRGVAKGFRRCSRCRGVQPADREHFAPKRVAGVVYLGSWCRQCVRAHARERMAAKRADPKWAEKVREAKVRHASSELGRATRRRRTRAENNLRRQRQTGRPYDWSPEQWEACLERWGRACAYCDAVGDLEQDHFIPVSAPDFPGTIPANMVPACRACNRSKGARSPLVWMADRKRLQRIVEQLVSLLPQ